MKPIIFPLLPLILMSSLGACASAPGPAPAVGAPSSGQGARRDIQAAIAPICSKPLTPAELERLAKLVETHRDPDTVWAAGKLDLLDREARVCRGS